MRTLAREYSFLRPWRLGEKNISQEVTVRAHEMLCSRQDAKGAKINSEYLLAPFASWREKYHAITSAGKNSRKVAKSAKIHSEYLLAASFSGLPV